MKVNLVNRMIVAVGVGAIALIGLSVPVGAQPQQNQKQQEKQKDKKDKKAKPEKPDQKQDQKDAKADDKANKPEHLPPQEQQKLIHQQQQRLAQYSKHLDEQARAAQQNMAHLQQQNRRAQRSYQEQYIADLQRQLSRAQSQANYNYGGDPYFYTPPAYRYSRGGQYYETNQYGADVLRHAVNVGYDQGVRAGLADRQDRWASGYQDSFAYQDANYGYGGFYVDRDDYNTYFREGFRRGYDDGYNSRSQYGRSSSGTGSILAEVLAKILNLQSIR